MASIGKTPYVTVVPWQAYYGFPYFSPQADPEAPTPPKPTNCVDVMKLHEEAVEKVFENMPEIQKLIIYRTLYAQNVRMDGIDRRIYKLAQEELKAIRAAGTP